MQLDEAAEYGWNKAIDAVVEALEQLDRLAVTRFKAHRSQTILQPYPEVSGWVKTAYRGFLCACRGVVGGGVTLFRHGGEI